MLNSINLDDKSFAEMWSEALAQIPLYSTEWTNINPSDPGYTILQNLTSFNWLQQSAINTVTDAIREKLLGLLGLTREQSHPASVLVTAHTDEEVTFARHKRFIAGDLCFETARAERLLPWRIAAVYREVGGALSDAAYLLDEELEISASVFGSPARDGTSLICVLEGKPDFTRPLRLYAKVRENVGRNPFEGDLRFAEIRWQIYTDSGWVNVAQEDKTHAFLVSGEIVLRAEDEPAVFTGAPCEGYAIRCVLMSGQYDTPPELLGLRANLIELTQQETQAAMFYLPGRRAVTLYSELLSGGVLYVYCRESKGGAYRAYTAGDERGGRGRFYRLVERHDGSVTLEFDKAFFGYCPSKGNGNVIAVCCTEKAARFRSLGAVSGYLEQEIEIEQCENIVRDGFCVVLETTGDDGQKEYRFERPGVTAPDGFEYELQSAEGRLIINDPGLGDDSRLFLASCAVTRGAEGNIRAGNRFIPLCEDDTDDDRPAPALINPSPGRGGITVESIKELRARFTANMKEPASAVTLADCEAIVRRTPGLCIDKVRAYAEPGRNLVNIVVRPDIEEQLAVMPLLYMREITRWIDDRRMMTTRIRLLQPLYIPIDVKGSIYVKSYFDNSRAEIERALRVELDSAGSEDGFGKPIIYNDILTALQSLPCVLSVFGLTLTPRIRGETSLRGMDIIPNQRCLCYPGEIMLELNTYGES